MIRAALVLFVVLLGVQHLFSIQDHNAAMNRLLHAKLVEATR